MSASSSGPGDQRLFDAVFEESRTAMLVVGADQRIRRANAAAAELTGFAPSALQGMALRRLRVPDDRTEFDELWRRAVARGSLTGVRHLLLADGGKIPVRWSATTNVAGDVGVIVYLPTPEPVGQEVVAAHDPHVRLTQRQREIVTLIALGQDTGEIAEQLHITVETVRTHVRNAMRTAGAHNRAHLVAQALQHGWIVDLD